SVKLENESLGEDQK
ncbi:unnamed protein product, partial [Rotaria sordida]